MSVYLKPTGIFDPVNNTNGSFFDISLVKEILGLDREQLKYYPWKINPENGRPFLDELTIQKIWYKIHRKNRLISFDEMVLAYLFRKYLPNTRITQQVRVEKYTMDFEIINVDDNRQKKIFVEFEGINHFVFSRYGEPKDFRIKKKFVEETTGVEVVNWAFWISRQKENVLRLFVDKIVGVGKIWNSNKLFGDFFFADSADLIRDVNQRFGIENCRDFYHDHPWNKDPEKSRKFFPPRMGDDFEYWK
jgi:very-short-patch-repair endonuclease